MGYTPYSINNLSVLISINNFLSVPNTIEQTYSLIGKPTKNGIITDNTGKSKTYKIIGTYDSNLSIDNKTGSITNNNVTPGLHNLIIYSDGYNYDDSKGYSITFYQLTMSNTIIQGDADSTIYIRQNSNTQPIQYRNNNSDWIDITKWPVTVINNNPQLGNGNLIINFTTDLTFTSSDQYFICGSHNIQFGLTSLKDDGTIPIIDISCNIGYPGLISNNNYYSNILIYNLSINGSNSILNDSAGWFCQNNYKFNFYSCIFEILKLILKI